MCCGGDLTILLPSAARRTKGRLGSGRGQGSWRGRLAPLEGGGGADFEDHLLRPGLWTAASGLLGVKQGGASLRKLALLRQGRGSLVSSLEIVRVVVERSGKGSRGSGSRLRPREVRGFCQRVRRASPEWTQEERTSSRLGVSGVRVVP